MHAGGIYYKCFPFAVLPHSVELLERDVRYFSALGKARAVKTFTAAAAYSAVPGAVGISAFNRVEPQNIAGFVSSYSGQLLRCHKAFAVFAAVGVAASAACKRNREYGCQQQGKRSDVFFHKRCVTVSPPCPNPTALRRRRMYRSYRPKAMQTP